MELKKEVWERVQKDAERMLEEVELSRIHATLMLNRAKMELGQIVDEEEKFMTQSLKEIEENGDKLQKGEKEGAENS